MAKLWMCDRLVTLMRCGVVDVELAVEGIDRTGEGCAAWVPDGVGCWEVGRTRGLSGIWADGWATGV